MKGKPRKKSSDRSSRSSKRQRERSLNYDLFDIAPETSKPTELPALAELYRKYDLFNALHFGRSLTAATISYSTRMLAAGLCHPHERKIKIGVPYHRLFPAEVDETLLHEMIHLIYPGHDRRFRSLAEQLGVSVHARYHPDLRRPPRFLYQCPECGKDYPRSRRLRETACGDCSGVSYDSRYKLRLVSSARRPGKNHAD